MRTCKKCGAEKPLNGFRLRTDKRTHRQVWRYVCLDCEALYKQQQYKDKPEIFVAQALAYAERHRQHYLAYQRAYHTGQPRPSKPREQRLRLPVEQRRTRQDWRDDNPESVKVIWKRRKAREVAAGGPNLPTAEWDSLKREFDFRCVCCLRREPEISLQTDHIVPISLGGMTVLNNVQPLCGDCNTRKFIAVEDYRSQAAAWIKEQCQEQHHPRISIDSLK